MARDPFIGSIGRIFYGIAIAAIGVLTIYYRDFPYFLLPPNHSLITDQPVLLYLCGSLLLLAGLSFVFDVLLLPVSLALGTALLAIFCFYFIPYQLLVSTNAEHFGDWENSAKTLALSGGAFVIAARCSAPASGVPAGFWAKLIPIGAICYPLTILSFGIDHYLYARQAAGYVPSWVSNPVFWLYLTGTALIGSSVGIMLKIKSRLMAALLGTMIFIWVLIVHLPKTLAAPFADNWGEVSSGFLALAYCGVAFVIAGMSPKVPDFKAKTSAREANLSTP